MRLTTPLSKQLTSKVRLGTKAIQPHASCINVGWSPVLYPGKFDKVTFLLQNIITKQYAFLHTRLVTFGLRCDSFKILFKIMLNHEYAVIYL